MPEGRMEVWKDGRIEDRGWIVVLYPPFSTF
jgi:hypothetical protein